MIAAWLLAHIKTLIFSTAGAGIAAAAANRFIKKAAASAENVVTDWLKDDDPDDRKLLIAILTWVARKTQEDPQKEVERLCGVVAKRCPGVIILTPLLVDLAREAAKAVENGALEELKKADGAA